MSAVRLLLPWVVFAAGWAIEARVDYSLRMADGDVHTGGLDRELWFSLHVGLGLVALAVAIVSLRRWPLGRRLAVLGGQCLLGWVLYVFACLSYGIASGIDYL